jgi:lysophospholipase L1-like esterase
LYVKKFDFGSFDTAEGYIQITEKDKYSAENGYGLDRTDSLKSGGKDALGDYITTNDIENGISFTVDVPDGDYKVTVTTGGDVATKSNIYINGGERVRVYSLDADSYQDNEQPVVPKDGKITIQVIGAAKTDDEATALKPSISSLTVEQLSAREEKREKPAIYIAGDSTAQTYNYNNDYPQTGWGQVAGDYFDESAVELINRSIGGRSLKSYNNDGRLDRILTELYPGDYVFIQFGHNDSSSKPERYISVDDFKELMKTKYIGEIQKRGAYPVILTPTPHYSPDDNGKFSQTIIDYSNAAREVASELNVPLIDIQQAAVDKWNELGAEKVKTFYFINEKNESVKYPTGTDDHTHFKEAGARQIAKLVAEGVSENIPELADSVFAGDHSRVFDDISGHWAADYISKLADTCIVNGKSQTEFDPEGEVSRAEFLTMAMRAYSINGKAYRPVGTAAAAAAADSTAEVLDDIYADVAEDSWYRFNVQGAQDKSIIPSFMIENDTFSPDKAITREEAASVIKLCADYANAQYRTTRIIPSFDDFTSVNKDAVDAVMFVVNARIMNGMNEDEFAPEGKLTRAQAAVIISRAIDGMN